MPTLAVFLRTASLREASRGKGYGPCCSSRPRAKAREMRKMQGGRPRPAPPRPAGHGTARARACELTSVISLQSMRPWLSGCACFIDPRFVSMGGLGGAGLPGIPRRPVRPHEPRSLEPRPPRDESDGDCKDSPGGEWRARPEPRRPPRRARGKTTRAPRPARVCINKHMCVHVCMYVCIYIYIYVGVYIYIYIYIHTYVNK